MLLLVARCAIRVCCLRFAIGCVCLFVCVCCLIVVRGCRFSFVASCSLFGVGGSLSVVRCSLCVACCSLCIRCCWLLMCFVGWCSLIVVRCALSGG